MRQPIKSRIILLFVFGFIAGSAVGAAVQRSVGLGNILRSIGYSYPTRTPIPPTPTPLPNLSAEIPEIQQGQLALFILAGQSNMSGVGPVPPDAPAPSPQIFVFGNDYHWHIAQEPIDNPAMQVDEVSKDKFAGFSPGLAFATSLLALDPERSIGLIPCAKGSTSISQWGRDLSDNSLYGSCLKRARAASTMGEIAGILFFQGEDDAVDPVRFPARNPQPHEWAERFSQWVADFRRDLGDPTLPIIFAQIGVHRAPELLTEWETVQAQQASIQLPRVAMIRTEDLTLQDEVHFSAESYQVIGARFAEAYWQLYVGDEPD